MKKIISGIARIGYAAKGIVYLLVGLLAFQVALGMKSSPEGTKQALNEFLFPPFGKILLIAIAIGLLAHAVWRILKAVIDPEDRDGGSGLILMRSVDFLTGCLYVSLSYASLQIVRGLNTGDSEENTQVWVSRILDLPYGKWLVLFLALIITIGGFYQFYSAYKATFDYNFDTGNMSDHAQNILRWLGRIGIAAWGVVYLMVAILFYKAAINYDADQAGGLSAALNALREQPFGIWILGITAAGLITYGLYLLMLPFYIRIYGRKKT